MENVVEDGAGGLFAGLVLVGILIAAFIAYKRKTGDKE